MIYTKMEKSPKWGYQGNRLSPEISYQNNQKPKNVLDSRILF